MIDKSKKRKKQSRKTSSSSSDNSADDPDYTVNLSERRLFSSFKSYKRKKTRQSQRQKPIKKTRTLKLASTKCDQLGLSAIEMKGCANSRKNKNSGSKCNGTTIYSWLIDSNAIEENAQVYCIGKHKKHMVKEGIVKREGILCHCCNKMFNALAFTSHCHMTTNKPYDFIFIAKTHVTVLSCMIEAWNNPNEYVRRRFNDIKAKGNVRDDFHDDACMICADGGNLMCCENCNSTYHNFCMGMEGLPCGSWYCPYCVCKFCGAHVLGDDYLIDCPQCEKKYHWGCYVRRQLKTIDLNEKTSSPFCEMGCKKVYEKWESDMVGVKNEIDEGYCWTLLHQMDENQGIYTENTYERTICHSKLVVAHRLMEDSFEPIFDRHSKINMIPSIVYNCGSNFKRIQFKGFYTAVLEKDDEIISAACLRIHGTKLAEMPFIATSNSHRRKGMCKKLMVAIESALCNLNVQYLIIPSTAERIDNWISNFGFNLLDDELKEELMCYKTVMFHDSVRLYKTLMSPHLLTKSDGQKSTGDSVMLQKAENKRENNSSKLIDFTRKNTKASLFDWDIEASPLNKNSWMKYNDDAFHYI